ncbi:hypothetical protein [Iningainema tapete]|uniref:Uncharacterized protein n=1 Tax=Iningainema tapete BLCC-T55 TaxID=2748662 RepID=A0A8J6XPG5_9CYAN|nr:hypothetical protein [Iningainema tapete]MBD2776876.1 hypothetical protein [Iningainema tapete BLCC-T55]
MLFVFRPEHLVGIANGTLKQVVSSSGVPLSMVRDVATGKIVGHAVGIVSQPFVVIPELIMDGLQMIQIDRGFQKTYRMLDALQNSVGVLQATTALIGVGTVASVVLSAVNLHQILKLREDVKQLRVEVKDGFIDLKQALKDQGAEIIKRIDQVAQDIKFEAHRLVLIQAYGKFQQALKLIKTALSSEDISIRNATLGHAQIMLSHALADYNSPHLLSETCAAGHLRRMECAWAIEQTFALTYQLQNQSAAVCDLLANLQDKISQDCLTVIEQCESEEELDFLFPEINRICNHDLPVLSSWQNHADWMRTLSPDERQFLAISDIQYADILDTNQDSAIVKEAEELLLYKNLKQKSHYLSLRDQLLFIIKPSLRTNHESYITQQATASGYKGLAPSNWQEIPDLTVANLYWYFKVKNKENCL